jgi:hypothetical protein
MEESVLQELLTESVGPVIFPDLSCLFRNIWPNLLGLCLFRLIPKKLIVVGLGNLQCQYLYQEVLIVIDFPQNCKRIYGRTDGRADGLTDELTWRNR